MNELLKYFHVCQSYHKKPEWVFFDSRCTTTTTTTTATATAAAAAAATTTTSTTTALFITDDNSISS